MCGGGPGRVGGGESTLNSETAEEVEGTPDGSEAVLVPRRRTASLDGPAARAHTIRVACVRTCVLAGWGGGGVLFECVRMYVCVCTLARVRTDAAQTPPHPPSSTG